MRIVFIVSQLEMSSGLVVKIENTNGNYFITLIYDAKVLLFITYYLNAQKEKQINDDRITLTNYKSVSVS